MPESGPTTADRAQQLQARAPETAGSDSEFMPPGAMGILDLQRKAGNRAVTAAIRAGGLWSAPGGRPMPMLQLMPDVQRWAGNRAATHLRGVIQREGPARDASGAKAAEADKLASKILYRIHKAVRVAHGSMQHVDAKRADELIGLVGAYTMMYPDFLQLQRILLGEHEDMYELLAPWGFSGRAIKVGEDGRLTDDQPIESLLAALAAWRGENATARKKRRAKTEGMFGFYDREITTAEIARDDSQLEAGPSRDSPADPWEDTHEGTRGNRRLERQDIRNKRALATMSEIKNQGPGGFAGMVVGGALGMLPWFDAQKSMEVGMRTGALFDPLLQARGDAGVMKNLELGAADRHYDTANSRKGPERVPAPTPDRPGAGAGALGGRGGGGGPAGGGGGRFRPGVTRPGLGDPVPAGAGAKPVSMGVGAPGPAGIGARPREGVAHLTPVSPGAVIAAFRRNPNYVRRSTSNEWHQQVYEWELERSGKWTSDMIGPSPPAPMAFHLEGGMMQVNEIAWFEKRGNINEILRPHERVGNRGGGGGGGRGGAGRSGTQVGFEGGPGGSGGAAAKPAQSGKTQKGVPPGPGGAGDRPEPMWRVPTGPSPFPKGNVHNAVSAAEVKKLFKENPAAVVLGDNPRIHQFIWENVRWEEGRPTQERAPAAFRLSHGRVRVDPEAWKALGENPRDLFTPEAPTPARQPNALEAANTLPAPAGGAGGPGGTNVSIAPGHGRNRDHDDED